VREKNITSTPASSVVFEAIESFARVKVQEFLQRVLEEEVTELLGRKKSERIATVDAEPGYRNGYGKPRKLAMMCGTIALRRPRVRGQEGKFLSRILPLFHRRSQEVSGLLPELYLHGLAQGDFELALRGLLGEGAPLSASSIQRLREKWVVDYEAWRNEPLEGTEVVYLWADGIFVKAGLEDSKAALLVVVAGLRDGRKVILAVESGYRESKEAWGNLLRDLRRRGLTVPRLVIADGHLGIWAALGEVFPESEEQRCWNHRIVNVLDQLPRKLQGQAKTLLCSIPYAQTRAEAERLRDRFVQRYGKAHVKAGETLRRDWERMVTFYRFPKEHWKHLRTTNPVESPFSVVRLRTSAGKRYKRVENATALIWKILRVAESAFRRLDHPELLPEVAEGARYLDGIRVAKFKSEAAA